MAAHKDAQARLKEEHAVIKKRESADSKQMFDLQQKNKQLSEPLRRTHQDVDRLQDELRAVRDAHRGAEQALAQLRRAFQEQVQRGCPGGV